MHNQTSSEYYIKEFTTSIYFNIYTTHLCVKEDYLKISICDEHNVIFNGIIRKLRTINKIDVLDVAHMSKKIIKTRNRRNGNKLLLYRNNESKCKQMASVGAFN